MIDFHDVANLSSLPVVDLHNIRLPTNGTQCETPLSCQKHFKRSDACKEHYETLLSAAATVGTLVQCPYGFASYRVDLDRLQIAITSLIPHPRLGGPQESALAKTHSANKTSVDAIKGIERQLRKLERHLEELEKRTIEGHAVALHEIRKLNAKIKQSSERLCMDESPLDPERATPQLVTVWKSSELMSLQFDIIEILANESLATLPVSSETEIYRLFDKCARIYDASSQQRRIKLVAPYDFRPVVRVCDKTIAIIPTALIENALKYSLADTPVVIEFYTSKMTCCVDVKNQAILPAALTNEVLKKGVRLGATKEGSGNGLFLAKLVASQHNAKLTVATRPLGDGLTECTFHLAIPTLRMA
jgi:light-regulated signal transduction histidine kinase (bacteriophytochrome)